MIPKETYDRRCILITGPPNSGSKALARIVHGLGADLPRELVPAGGEEKEGRMIPAVLNRIHGSALESAGLKSDGFFALPEGWWLSKSAEKLRQRVSSYLDDHLSESKFFAVCDPNIWRFIPGWLQALERFSAEPLFVIPLRDPFEVAHLLKQEHGAPISQSLLIWLRCVLEAEFHSRGRKRIFADFKVLYEDPIQALNRIGQDLDLDWTDLNRPSCCEKDQCLFPKGPFMGKALGDGSELSHRAEAIYSELLKISEKRENGFGLLDRTRTELDGADLVFRPVLEDYLRGLEAREAKVEELQTRISELDDQVDGLLNSRSWQITRPMRTVKAVWKDKTQLKPIMARMGYSSAKKIFHAAPLPYEWKFRVKNHPLVSGLISRLNKHRPSFMDYSLWIRENDTLTNSDRTKIEKNIQTFDRSPLLSIVMPVYNPPLDFLKEAIESVISQIYQNWELCIAEDASPDSKVRELLREYAKKDERIKVIFRPENGGIVEASNSALNRAQGDFIVLMDHDDKIPPHAMFMVAHEINRHPEVDLIYSDEDKIDTKGFRYDPYFKSDFNQDLFYSQNHISHLGVYRASLVKELGGFRKEFEGSQDYDLALRVIEKTTPDRIRHIPFILYHWRAIPGSVALDSGEKTYAHEAARRAIADHLRRTGVEASVTKSPCGELHRVIYTVPRDLPLTSIIIPTVGDPEVLGPCIDGILNKTDYPPLELILIPNNVPSSRNMAFLESLKDIYNVRIIPYDKPFSFSRMYNFSVPLAKGDLIGLLNDDIEIIHRDWLKEMVSHAVRPEIGLVGAKLLYPDDTIQHAGLIFGLLDSAGHVHKKLPRLSPGYFGRAQIIQNFLAVTAACIVMRKNVFSEMNGFDENLAVAYNDVDFCLRVNQAGYRILWTPHAELFHMESITRGSDDLPEARPRFLKELEYFKSKWEEQLLRGDPFFNPNLDLYSEHFELAPHTRVKKPWLMDQDPPQVVEDKKD